MNIVEMEMGVGRVDFEMGRMERSMMQAADGEGGG